MQARARARDIRGSIVVVIPNYIIKEENIREGDVVLIEIKNPGKAFSRKHSIIQYCAT